MKIILLSLLLSPLIGNASNVPAEQAVSGDATITNMGVVTVAKASASFNVNAPTGATAGLTNSTLGINGSVATPIRVTSSSTTLTNTDYTIISTGSAVTLTLPAASSAYGRIYNIVNTGTGAVTFSVALQDANATTTTTLGTGSGFGGGAQLGNRYVIQSDDTNWYIISH